MGRVCARIGGQRRSPSVLIAVGIAAMVHGLALPQDTTAELRALIAQWRGDAEAVAASTDLSGRLARVSADALAVDPDALQAFRENAPAALLALHDALQSPEASTRRRAALLLRYLWPAADRSGDVAAGVRRADGLLLLQCAGDVDPGVRELAARGLASRLADDWLRQGRGEQPILDDDLKGWGLRALHTLSSDDSAAVRRSAVTGLSTLGEAPPWPASEFSLALSVFRRRVVVGQALDTVVALGYGGSEVTYVRQEGLYFELCDADGSGPTRTEEFVPGELALARDNILTPAGTPVEVAPVRRVEPDSAFATVYRGLAAGPDQGLKGQYALVAVVTLRTYDAAAVMLRPGLAPETWAPPGGYEAEFALRSEPVTVEWW